MAPDISDATYPYNRSMVQERRARQGEKTRILALDVGARRIGMAVSDPLGITAQGINTLYRRNRQADFDLLKKVIGEYQIKEIVVGFPLKLSGEKGAQAEKILLFTEELKKRFAGPVHLWDERLTTAEAHRVLDEAFMRHRRRKQVIDQMAAVLILQSFLENRGGRN